MEAVLKRIQRFDPVGVGARDLRECLMVQLKILPPETPSLKEALAIADQHLALLGNRISGPWPGDQTERRGAEIRY